MEIVPGRRNRDKKKDNTKAADELRLWVQLPPGPFLLFWLNAALNYICFG
jgi:hypothetical protein